MAIRERANESAKDRRRRLLTSWSHRQAYARKSGEGRSKPSDPLSGIGVKRYWTTQTNQVDNQQFAVRLEQARPRIRQLTGGYDDPDHRAELRQVAMISLWGSMRGDCLDEWSHYYMEMKRSVAEIHKRIQRVKRPLGSYDEEAATKDLAERTRDDDRLIRHLQTDCYQRTQGLEDAYINRETRGWLTNTVARFPPKYKVAVQSLISNRSIPAYAHRRNVSNNALRSDRQGALNLLAVLMALQYRPKQDNHPYTFLRKKKIVFSNVTRLRPKTRQAIAYGDKTVSDILVGVKYVNRNL